MSRKPSRAAITLRPQVHPPDNIVKFAKMLDDEEFSSVSNIFVPDIPSSFESIEISCASLAATKRLRIGSGVIRLLEHDVQLLARRLETIQSFSNNRFILGIGTGAAGPKPGDTIRLMMERLAEVQSSFTEIAKNTAVAMPETYVATLKSGIARRVSGKSTGVLLNFCSPEYAQKLANDITILTNNKIDLACYLKVFYSRDQNTADRLLAEEFVKYDSIGPYHKMFERVGVDVDIRRAKETLERSGKVSVSDSLLRISLPNPSESQLREYVNRFRECGITLPCVYPYFSAEDDFEFRKNTIKNIPRAL